MNEDFPAYAAGFRAGSMFAGYRVQEPVGRGGMAVVYRARDERLRRPVALKVLLHRDVKPGNITGVPTSTRWPASRTGC